LAVHKRNLKRLAALSAVGAGAMGVTADRAEASIISGTVSAPNVVGWNDPLTAVGSLAFTLTGTGITVTAQRSASQTTNDETTTFYRFISVIGNSTAFHWRVQGPSTNLLQIVSSGQKWSTVAGTSGEGNRAYPGGRTWINSAGGYDDKIYGPSSISNQYALFTFKPGSTTLYGWMQLSYSVTSGVGPVDALGPIMTVTRWAYEDGGDVIAAGFAGASVPEPGTFALAALALGAIGMRRWRSCKAQE
jgi:hypothetical protein